MGELTKRCTLSAAISLMGCRHDSSSGFMLIRQLTEQQLWTCYWTVVSAAIPIQWTENSWKTVDSRDMQPSEWIFIWASCIWTPKFSLNLISQSNWISTENWLRWWYSLVWGISPKSVTWTLSWVESTVTYQSLQVHSKKHHIVLSRYIYVTLFN